MEGIICQLKGSSLRISERELQLTISRQFWSKRQWAWLVKVIGELVAEGLGWLLAPSRGSIILSPEGNEALKWKENRLDGLSLLLFALLIPASHPLRRLYQALDWDFIDERCARVYQNQQRGAPAYRPQVLFRVLVLMVHSGTPFESATLQRLQTDVAWRWFVGLSLLVPVPNAGTLSYFRRRLGVELFEAIFIDLLQLCDQAGLIGHQESYYDLTGIEASATQISPYQRAVILAKALSASLEGQETELNPEQIASLALETLQESHPSLKEVKAGQLLGSQQRLEQKWQQQLKEVPRWWQRLSQRLIDFKQELSQLAQWSQEQLSHLAQELVTCLPQTFGNPDATVGHMRRQETACGYRGGFLVDAKHRIITAVVLTPLNQVEAPSLLVALAQHRAIFGHYPLRLGLDSAFDRDELHLALERCQIESVATVRSRPGPKGLFHADAFVWNEAGQLLCPQGEVMVQIGGPFKDGRERYRASGDCPTCPLLERCLTAKQQQQALPRRQLEITPAAHQGAQRNRQRSRGEAGRALRRRRFAAEGLFGHLNHYHNGDRAPYRNQPMDTIALLMVAFVSNLEKLVAYA